MTMNSGLKFKVEAACYDSYAYATTQTIIQQPITFSIPEKNSFDQCLSFASQQLNPFATSVSL